MVARDAPSPSAVRPAPTRTERYRQTERALWERYGLAPIERFVELDAPRVRLRVLEVGVGEPVLFVPGTAGTGPVWAPLVRELPGFRCLLLDRPGWGLSGQVDYAAYEYGTLVADVQRGVLDALGVGRAHIVGASIGDVWALRLAAGHPERVGRIVLLGGGPVVPEVPPPPFIRLLASPLGALLVRVPQPAGRVRAMLRQNGHGASLETGRIPGVYVDWRVALGRYTDSMQSERAMVRALVGHRGTWRPGLTFGEADLAALQQPILLVYGSADPVGTADLWRRVVSRLPRGELRLVDGAGHVPWLDEPERIAADISHFLPEGDRRSP